MARALSDEDWQLRTRARRRLIGAVVLVAAAVVVLPMVLDTEPRPREPSVSVQIPSPDSITFASRIAPLPEGAAGAQTPPAQRPAEQKPALPAAREAAPQAPKSASAPEPKVAAAHSPAARPPAKAKGGTYVVQVIALADARKARELRDRIAAGGLPSYTEVVKTVKGDVTRVRVGPFQTREAAEKARAGLKDMGLGGNVTRR